MGAQAQSEYEYAEISLWNGGLGGAIAHWSSEGWDVVTASYGGGTSCATDYGHALLRRKRSPDAPYPPNTQLREVDARGSTVVAENNARGSWIARRYCACEKSHGVARVYWFPTARAALMALAKYRADPEVAALWLRGERNVAGQLLRSRGLNLSAIDADWLMHEIDPTFMPEFTLR